MNWDLLKGKIRAGYLILKGKVQPSYSQAGEDQIMRYLLNDCLQLANPSYLDIGTFHPIFGNNTYYFYTRGSRGVCIEPNPSFAPLIRKYRKKDTFIQAGVGVDGMSQSDYFLFPEPYAGWNTFSKEEAETRSRQTGIEHKKKENVSLVAINDVIATYFGNWPNIISLDVEGLDLLILKSLDFQKYRPEIICVESITFSNNNEQEKIESISSFVRSQGYFVFADTYVNTIFCRNDAFKKIVR